MSIHRQTVVDALWDSLVTLMNLKELADFRLVGGTSLSLMIGHRMSVDIDMFTDAEYGSINFVAILNVLKKQFPYVEYTLWQNNSISNSCFIGHSPEDSIKLDLYYTDPFIYPIIHHEKIRLSSLEEIAAMKWDVIGRGGRKKDFWDIHSLLDHFDFSQMIQFY